MTKCPECDSEVAELDTFCPYCGISLNPVVLPADAAADEMASTIVMSSKPKLADIMPAPDSKAAAPEAVAVPTPQILEKEVPPAPAVDAEEESPEPVVGSTSSVSTEPEPIVEKDVPVAETESAHAEPDEPALETSEPAEDLAGPEVADDEVDFPTVADLAIAEPEPEPEVSAEAEALPEPEVEPVASVSAPEETEIAASVPEVAADELDDTTVEQTLDEFGEVREVPEFIPAPSTELPDEPASPASEFATLIQKEEADESPSTVESAEIENEPAAVEEPIAETAHVEAVAADEPASDPFESTIPEHLLPEPEDSVHDAPMVVVEEIMRDANAAADDGEQVSSAEPSMAEHIGTEVPESVLRSDAYFGAEPIREPETSVSAEPEAGSEHDEVTSASPEPAAETPVPATGAALGEPLEQTDSGRVISDSGTTPNIGTNSTDGRKSGLKPLGEGTILNGRYQIAKKIGGGGMGAVYLAFDQNLGNTQRAVKEMVQSHIEEDQQAKAIEDFKRESMILSTLDHPSIPTIYDYFYDESESRFYLVMKYISGGDLAARLRSAPEGRIDEKTVTEWAIQIIDVLDYLHSLPTTIVYRDLKPSNVMIDGNTGRIMLIDFGIARSINQTQEKGVTAVGTMGYAPPELFSGQVEPRSDIYSLGSTMFHLLTGADPQNNPLLIFDFQKNPRPRQINPRLSDQMERILMRAVEYNADARFASAAEMRRALQDHLENLQSGKVSYGISESPAAVSLAHQNVFCGFCGQRIVATDLFCAFCGSKQPLAQQGVHSEIYARGNVTARLVIEGTSDLTAPAYPLEKTENLVGRRDPMSNIFPEVDLSKYDPQTKISRRHARIWREGDTFLVEDLGSSNGTLLLSRVSDALRLAPHMPHPIASGDRLKIGDTTLQFVVG